LTNYLKTPDSEWYKQRLTVFLFYLAAAFILLFARLFYLQIIEGEELRRLSENNCIRLETIDPQRGLIYDRNGKLLVDNRPSFDLSIVLKDALPIEQTIARLARYTTTPEKKFAEKLKEKKGLMFYRPVLLKQDIGRDALGAIEVHRFDLPGVVVSVKPRRHYIHKQLAAHMLGYLGEINSTELKSGLYPECRAGDFIGKFGAEKTYDSLLRGRRGGRQVEANVKGQVVKVLKTVNAVSGNNLFLTIDLNLQKKAEELLLGKAGAAIAIDPRTGQILALASSPAFDQNAFVNGMTHKQWRSLISNPFRPMENKALQGEYPPASTYKIVTAMAGLEEGAIDENTSFYCPGYYKYGGREYRCWKKGGHGKVEIVKAISESCDVFFYQVGLRLGVDKLARYAQGCGLGALTGIQLDHEAHGLVPTAAWKKRRTGVSWQKGETLSVAIGQGYNLATPLQMLMLISSIANGGIRLNPLILKNVKTPEGKIIFEPDFQAVGKLPVSRKTLSIVKKGLWEVVNGNRGTARGSRVKGIEISGKTGTAQVVSRNENDRPLHLKSHAWFVAYAPSAAPQIAISVIVEHGEHGSSAAAPIAKGLIEIYLGGAGTGPD
jgi:penicillin-binding protein 2